MGFPGVWTTETGSLIYRVVPKCACSTIGQIMFWSDHGRYHQGDIHDADSGLHKWGIEATRPAIETAIREGRGVAFTSVRNPYTRILSTFFDKIAGIQRNGRRYRGNLVPQLAQQYGVDVGRPEDGFAFDQIASFRRFLLFARDTIRFRKPMDPDIHWSAIAGHVGTFVHAGGRFDVIVATEEFDAGMTAVLDRATTPVPVDLAAVPRFNESEEHGPRRAHPASAYFDDLSHHLMREIYHRDFDLFGYALDDPDRLAPTGPFDLDRIHRLLSG